MNREYQKQQQLLLFSSSFSLFLSYSFFFPYFSIDMNDSQIGNTSTQNYRFCLRPRFLSFHKKFNENNQLATIRPSPTKNTNCHMKILTFHYLKSPYFSFNRKGDEKSIITEFFKLSRIED